MKSILGAMALVIGLCVSSARADIRVNWSFVMKPITTERCWHYSERNIKAFTHCQRALGQVLKIMDLGLTLDLKDEGGALGFQKTFLKMIRDPHSLLYLHKLNDLLKSVGKLPNLWDFTSDFYEGDRFKALRAIAVLLQDPSFAIHLAYLKEQFPNEYDHEIKLLDEIYKKLLVRVDFRLYPKGFPLIQRDAYHFYNIAYMTMLMERSKKPGLSEFGPFMFNVTYEFLVNHCIKKQSPTDEPTAPEVVTASIGFWGGWIPEKYKNVDYPRCANIQRINPVKFAHSLGDHYMGWVGPKWAKNPDMKFPSLVEFVMKFSSNPDQFVKAELKRELQERGLR